jgi:hypothetical protein
MLRIRDILLQTRIRIRGSVPLRNLRIRILLFSTVAFKRCQQKRRVFSSFLQKLRSYKEFTKQEKSRFFLLFWLDDGRIRIRTNTVMTYPGGPKTYGSGFTILISKLTCRKAGELVVVDLLVLLVLSDEGGRLPLLPLDLHVHQLPLQLIVRINARI